MATIAAMAPWMSLVIAQLAGFEAARAEDAKNVPRDVLDVLARLVLGVRFGSLEVAIVDDYDARPAPYLHDDESILQISVCDLQS